MMFTHDEQADDVKRILAIKQQKSRRTFLRGASLLPLFMHASFANAQSTNNEKVAHIHMVGDLDDDLIIIKANSTQWDIECCQQMHNPVKFYLQGRCFDNELCPGYIEYSKQHFLKEDEVLVICLANEREERESDKKLLDRTHYKSVPLHVNGTEVIPSMIPENNDIDYATWYDPNAPEGVYNYYRVWENAVINLAVVVPKEGQYTLELINESDTISASSSFSVKKNHAINVIFKETLAGAITSHPLAEMDGGVFLHDNYKMPNDVLVRELSAYHIIIKEKSSKATITAPLPYPLPYINRIFFTAC